MIFFDLFNFFKSKKTQAYSSAFCRGVCLILIFAAALSLTACGGDGAPLKRICYDYFDTVCTISYYGDRGEDYFDQTADLIEGELLRYHRLFDAYHAYSGINNIYEINASAGNAPIVTDPAVIELISYGTEVYSLTGGEINIALGAVTALWREASDTGVLPSAEQLNAAGEHISIEAVTIDRKASSVYLSDPLMLLDVGSLGKGFAAERIAEALSEMGAEGFVLDLGGNIRTVGTKPDGSGWITGITDPHGKDNTFAARILIADSSCVTSGDYRRYFTVDGKKYHHIIDGDTLYPAEHFSSVTVVADDSALCDALSTALFCMPLDRGMALIEGTDGVEAFWIGIDGERFYSSGFKTLD